MCILDYQDDDSLLERTNCRAKGGASGFKVAILGAAGGIGQSLSLLMKINPLVSVLHLYDVVNTPGVTADISHMDTNAVVSYNCSVPLCKRYYCFVHFFSLVFVHLENTYILKQTFPASCCRCVGF